jgi:hypothetical protein
LLSTDPVSGNASLTCETEKKYGSKQADHFIEQKKFGWLSLWIKHIMEKLRKQFPIGNEPTQPGASARPQLRNAMPGAPRQTGRQHRAKAGNFMISSRQARPPAVTGKL